MVEMALDKGDATAFSVAQSRYFSPVFTAAIFDGPVRIYFAQEHEAQALKLYFKMQQCLGATRATRTVGSSNAFVMFYPTPESFADLFVSQEAEKSGLGIEMLGDDTVIGVRGPITDDAVLDAVCFELEQVMDSGLSLVRPIAAL